MQNDYTYFHLNSILYSLEDVKTYNFNFDNKTNFERATLQFCAEWLNGKDEFILKTSGSTGVPKSVTISAAQMKASAIMTLKALQLKEGDSAFICLNTEYIAGIMMLVRGLEGKLKMFIIEPSSNPLLGINPEYKFNFTALVPLQMQTIISSNESLQLLKDIDKIIIGGAPISQPLELFLQKMPNNFFHTYGMTETVSHIALRKIRDKLQANLYQVLEGIDIDIDERQCLMIKGAVTNFQWIITNDIVILKDKKSFVWKGRIDHVINSGGIKFQVDELEDMIHLIFQKFNIRRRFFIFGLANEKLGEEIALFIEGQKESDVLKKLQESLSENTEKYKNPKSIYFIESFIETPTGKINKPETIKLAVL